MDVVGEGRTAAGSGTGKRESGAGSEPGGSDKESDNDEKVGINRICNEISFHVETFITKYILLYNSPLCCVCNW